MKLDGPRQPSFVFVDESHYQMRGEPITAATATVWNVDYIQEFREELVASMLPQLQRENWAGLFPVLHASDMCPGYSDDFKLQCFSEVARLLVKYSVQVLRVGYFDGPFSSTIMSPLSLAINQVFEMARRLSDDLQVYVYELNRDKHNDVKMGYDDYGIHFQRAVSGDCISVPRKDRILGKFYCDKENLCMGATDVASYFLYLRGQPLEALSPFKSEIRQRLNPIDKLIKYDEIIYMNVGEPKNA